jgi:hypothetical protein
MAGVSHGSSHHITHDMLQFHEVFARWVPRQVIPELKKRCMNTCQELLRQYKTDGNGFLKCLMTGDESWIHCYKPKINSTSKELRHSSSPNPKKFCIRASAGKVMLTLL